MVRHGIELPAVMQAGGWRTPEMVSRYTPGSTPAGQVRPSSRCFRTGSDRRISLIRRLQAEAADPPVQRSAAPVLPTASPSRHAAGMFAVTEAEAAAIREAWNTGGELSAAVELRRLFPGIDDMARARECAMMIVGWSPIAPSPPAKAKRRKGG
jgi:hypothetical protein